MSKAAYNKYEEMYIEHLNQFWDEIDRKPLNAHAGALYLYLLHYAHEHNWETDLSISTAFLMEELGLSKSTLQRAQNVLIERGFIEVIPCQKGAIYRLKQ